jgi:hypothetical protein
MAMGATLMALPYGYGSNPYGPALWLWEQPLWPCLMAMGATLMALPYGYGNNPYGYGSNPYGYGSKPYGYGSLMSLSFFSVV